MQWFWFLWAGLAFAITLVTTPLIARIAEVLGVVDRPTGAAKELHRHPIPLLGGLAIFLGIGITIIAVLGSSNALTDGMIHLPQYAGFLIGGVVLMAGGFLDDKYDLPPSLTIWFPLLAALCAVIFGVGASKLTNPFSDSPIMLSTVASQLLTFVWLMIVMYTTKFLDGMDGLATGVSAIGCFMMLLLAATVTYFQPDIALLSFICLGSMVAFLLWNFNPATIFLGEGGSTFVGYTLGTLAVIGGGKLGTALLALSIPVLDVLWVVLRRTFIEHRSPTEGDRRHLHHRLLDLGLSQRQVVLLYYGLAAAVGLCTLFLQSKTKVIAFGVALVLMVVGSIVLVIFERRRRV